MFRFGSFYARSNGINKLINGLIYKHGYMYANKSMQIIKQALWLKHIAYRKDRTRNKHLVNFCTNQYIINVVMNY